MNIMITLANITHPDSDTEKNNIIHKEKQHTTIKLNMLNTTFDITYNCLLPKCKKENYNILI